MTPIDTLLAAFPRAFPYPDCDDTQAMAVVGKAGGMQLFRLDIKRPWLVDDGEKKRRAPKKPWADVWVPHLWVVGCGFSPGATEHQELTLQEAVGWLRKEVDETIASLQDAAQAGIAVCPVCITRESRCDEDRCCCTCGSDLVVCADESSVSALLGYLGTNLSPVGK